MNIKPLNKTEIIRYLDMDSRSTEVEALIEQSGQRSKKYFADRGYVFAQWGLNCEPCSLDCSFCSLGETNFAFENKFSLTVDEAVKRLCDKDITGVSDIFIMCSADYPFDDILQIGKEVSKTLPEGVRMVANVGDFTLDQAKSLRKAGFTGFYHIVRLREGIDTKGDKAVREETISLGMEAGLELYYCIEPIGPEHNSEEIAEEILRAQKLKPKVMAVMRRINIPGSPLSIHGEIEDKDLTKIAAVTNMAVLPERAMNVHEPCADTMRAGINQLYAELGVNPRDTVESTENSRGFSISKAWSYLNKNLYFDRA